MKLVITPRDFPDQAAWPAQEPLGISPNLTEEIVLAGYQRGAFPWYNAGEPVLWWSLDPRMVLWPSDFHLSKNLKRSSRTFRYTLNCAFREVMEACANTPRKDQEGTWIQPEMIDLYDELAHKGVGKSVEVWKNDELVGGLYGLQMGAVFFGESMFSTVSDASKAALYHLCIHADALGIKLIDCQMYTDHLASLGAREISRATFFKHLETLIPRI